ncbi:MAG: phosphatidate cytidylyltransferase [Chloroflexi bacterium]|nr:phosphatidate cytidylyltransferase [Chloroflexota bacterium]
MLRDLIGAGILLAYYLATCFALPTALKVWTGAPSEVVRKMQHIAYSLSVFILLRLFNSWYMAVAAAFLLVVVAYPVLFALEKTRYYKRWFADRAARGGEFRKQLMYVQLSFGVLICVFWGLLGIQWHYIVAVSVMAWGFGDAAAALVGKAFGRRHILHRFIEGAKTCEGTLAMVVVAALAVFLTLLFYAGQSWYVSLLVAVVVAPICGAVELFSQKGTDTITVPLAAALSVLPLMLLFSFIEW